MALTTRHQAAGGMCWAAAAGVVFLLGGCQAQRSEDGCTGAGEKNQSATNFDTPIRLWTHGDHDAALRWFERAPTPNPVAPSSLRVLRMTEPEFVSLSGSEQNVMQSEALALCTELKQLAVAAAARSDELAEVGEKDRALRLVGGLHALGDDLADRSRHLALVNLAGDMLQRVADEQQQAISR